MSGRGRPPRVRAARAFRWYAANRKTYDPAGRRWVDGAAILAALAADRRLRVLDAATGADVTARVAGRAARDGRLRGGR